MNRMIFISDVHFGGQQDLRAWNFALKIAEDIQPNEVILGGDIFDHEEVGRYRKNPDKVVRLQDELTGGIAELTKLREYLPTAKITFYRGNHERRLPNYLLDIAKALHGLEVFDPRNLYKLDDLGIEYIPETKPFKRGHLWVAHGDEFSTGGTSPASKALDDVNSNILFGHVHRFSVASKTQLNGRMIGGWSNGCLCSLTPDFVLQPDWTQGITIVDFTKTGYFAVTPVRFWYDRKYRALQTVVDGIPYDSRKGF